jgi:hypothetical protein
MDRGVVLQEKGLFSPRRHRRMVYFRRRKRSVEASKP